ncbi:MAG: Ig-like domain-containing protein, partial [Anaerolineales bacterium]|nr:Ig-like domain-containing protein [Anaerolineales bacterium]
TPAPLNVLHVAPAAAQAGISPDAWVSATFDRALDPATVNAGTVQLFDPWGYPVAGTAVYHSATRQIIFQPAAPLAWAAQTYRAAITTGVRGTDGSHLPQDHTWAFTVEPAPLQRSGKYVFFGDLHSHTAYSGHNGAYGLPTTAFTAARANGLDFLAVTEDAEYLTAQEWQDLLTQAQAATADGRFVALRGFQWNDAANGHVNVLGTDTFVSSTDPSYDQLPELYAWLAATAAPSPIAQFNTPTDPAGAFMSFAIDYPADDVFQLLEVGSGTQDHAAAFPAALAAGWHLGPTHNSRLYGNFAQEGSWWGQPAYRTGVLADALRYDALLEALRARRVFSTTDANAVVTLQANGAWMGSVVADGVVDLEIYVWDPDAGDVVDRLELYENGLLVDSITAPTDPYTWQVSRTTQPGSNTWWTIRAVQADGDVLHTAPIWTYAAAPTAEVISPQPGAVDVAWDAPIRFGFHPEMERGWLHPMDHASINAHTAVLSNGSHNISGTLHYDDQQRTWRFQPVQPLRPGTVYTMTLSGEIRDSQAPRVHLAPLTWSFTTEGAAADRLTLALTDLRDAFDHELATNRGYAAEVVHLAWDAAPPGQQIELGQLTIEALMQTLVTKIETAVQQGEDPLVALELGVGASLATTFGLDWSRSMGQRWILNAVGDTFGVTMRSLLRVGYDAQLVSDRLDAQLLVPASGPGSPPPATGVAEVRSHISADFDQLIAAVPATLPNTPDVEALIRYVESLANAVRHSNNRPVTALFWHQLDSTGQVALQSALTGLVFKDRAAFIELYRQHAAAEYNAAVFDLLATRATTVGTLAAIPAGGGLIPIISFAALDAINMVGETVLIQQEQLLTSLMIDVVADLQAESADLWRIATETQAYVAAALPGAAAPMSPPPVTVQALDFPHVTLTSAEWSTATGRITLHNAGSTPLSVAPVVQMVHLGAETAVSPFSTQLTPNSYTPLLPGQTHTLTVTYTLPRSTSFGDTAGYDAVIRIAVANPAGGQPNLLGPYVAHLYAESPARLALLASQTADVIASGTLQPAATRQFTITTRPDSEAVWIKLFQNPNSNLDLHVYDDLGRHVGHDYAAGATETQIAGAAYSGADAPLEWVALAPADGRTYHVKVFAQNAGLNAPFVLARHERGHLPALLDVPLTALQLDGSQMPAAFAIPIREVGRSTPLASLHAAASDLVSSSGAVIPAAAVTWDALPGVLWPGQALLLGGAVNPGTPLADGVYRGTFTISAVDAFTAVPLTQTIATALWLDTTPPTSTVAALPAYTTVPTFTVSWQGQDALRGVAWFEVQVREGDVGAWHSWLTHTVALSATFTGQDSSRYAFRVRATDHAGNVEPWPAAADAVTTIDASPPSVWIISPWSGLLINDDTVTVRIHADDNVAIDQVALSTDGGATWQTVAGVAPQWQTVWQVPPADNDPYVLLSRATDVVGRVVTSAPVTVAVDTVGPALHVHTPTAGQLITGTHVITGTASDGSAPGYV